MYRMVTGLNDGCAPPPLRDLWLFPCPLPQMVVTTGLLDLLSSKDELAAVLAHETAHVLARHHVSHSCLWESNALQDLSLHARVALFSAWKCCRGNHPWHRSH